MRENEGKVIGIVVVEEIGNMMLGEEVYDGFRVGKVMSWGGGGVYDRERMEEVMGSFEDRKGWKVGVVEGEGKYVGLVWK